MLNRLTRNLHRCWIVPRKVYWWDVTRFAAEVALLIAVGALIWADNRHDEQKQKNDERLLAEWEAANAQNLAKCSSAAYPYCTYDKRGDRIAGCEEAEPPVAECKFRPAGRPDVEGKPSKLREVILWMIIASISAFLLFAVVAWELYFCWGLDCSPRRRPAPTTQEV